MKITTVLFAAALLFAGAAQSQAAEINFSGFNYDMQTVAAGDFGSIATSDKVVPLRNIETGYVSTTEFGMQHDFTKGILPANTKITFTFNTTPKIFKAFGSGVFAEGYGQVADSDYIYRAWAASDLWTWNEKAGADGVFSETGSTLGLTAASSLNAGKDTATLIITNLSQVAANFESYFFSPSDEIGGLITTSYNVSAVPLPAALPLFGLALAGLAGYNRKKKMRKAA